MHQQLTQFKKKLRQNESKRFVPTELGEIVHEQVKDYFPEIIDVDFTVNMETLLDKVAEGDIAWKKVISDFTIALNKMLNVQKKKWKNRN